MPKFQKKVMKRFRENCPDGWTDKRDWIYRTLPALLGVQKGQPILRRVKRKLVYHPCLRHQLPPHIYLLFIYTIFVWKRDFVAFCHFWVIFGGVDIFGPKLSHHPSVYGWFLAVLTFFGPKLSHRPFIFDYTHSVKISAQTDQNSQSSLFSVYGHFWAASGGVWYFFGPKLLHIF